MRKLGETQVDILKFMLYSPNPRDKAFVSQWRYGGGWVWKTGAGTERIMETLAARGLVDKKRIRGNPYARFNYVVNEKKARAALEAQGIKVKKWGQPL